MAEIKTELKTFMVEMQCDQCGKGMMERTNATVLTSNPPQYTHSCTSCGYSANYTTSYPNGIHEKITQPPA